MEGDADRLAPRRREDNRRIITIIIAVTLLIALSVSLSGCSLQAGLETVVNDDGSGNIGIRLAADKALQGVLEGAGAGLGDLGSLFGGLMEKLPIDADALFLLILGNISTDWVVDRGSDKDGTQWIKVSRAFTDPDDLKTLLTDSVLSKFVDADRFLLSQDRGFFRTKTVFSTTADMSQAMEEVQEGGSGLPRELLERVLSIDNRVTLPGTVKDNNADETDGNMLVWHLGMSGGREMYAESVDYNWGRIIGIAAAAFVVLVVLVVVLLLLMRRCRRRRQAGAAGPEPPVPPADAQQTLAGGTAQSAASAEALQKTAEYSAQPPARGTVPASTGDPSEGPDESV